ncbi:MAG: chromate transporter [Eubacteriales bacterium]|jgi:chromate transporter|nr:chromate transporter [Eubacteriales bacterium]MDD3572495.1 chromate transporter [Eubacteriales bacterium]MDD4135356.1 chromate transporter [Eubacteriales bacterium]NLO13881.1 chromate transporter [Clostridiales bacterium]
MAKELLGMYLLFFKMGMVTFGGGYAMLPILRREIVEKRAWLTDEQVIDFFAVSQTLPGIIASNVSVFIGYQRRKTPGAIAAALGVVTPSVIIITLIAALMQDFQYHPMVRHAFKAIAICVCALILSAVISMWKRGVKDWAGVVIAVAVFALAVFTQVSPVWLVLASAFAGVAMKRAGKGKA